MAGLPYNKRISVYTGVRLDRYIYNKLAFIAIMSPVIFTRVHTSDYTNSLGEAVRPGNQILIKTWVCPAKSTSALYKILCFGLISFLTSFNNVRQSQIDSANAQQCLF